MLYYLQYNIRIRSVSFWSPLGWVSGHCPQSTGGEIWHALQEYSICTWLCSFNSHLSEVYIVPYWNLPVWWDPQSEIPEWLREKGLIVRPKVGVCEYEYGREDWYFPDN